MNTLQNLPFRLLFLLGLFLANFWYGSPVQVEAQVIPQDQLLVVGVDSEQNSSYRAARSLDGNVATMWHTQWSPIVAPFPHNLTLKLPTSYTVTGLRYLPRQDGNQNGIITAYAIYVSADGITWGTAVTSGTWPGTSALKEVRFSGTEGRYVRLVATAAANRLTYTSAAEINVLGTPRLTPPSSVSAAKSLSWVDSSTNEDGFKIERKVGTTGTFVRLAVVRANTTSYKDADTTTGTPYCYRVQAFNAAGDSPFSNEACTTGQSTTTFTAAPVNNQISGNGNHQSTNSALTSSSEQVSKSNSRTPDNQQPLRVQIGVFRPSTATWYLDRNANGQFDDCTIDTCSTTFGIVGDLPVIGDWKGTGTDQLGVFNPATQMWDLDKNGDDIWEACDTDLCYGPFGKTEDLPISGFWQAGTKVATIGVYRPRTGQWFLDLNGNGRIDLVSGDSVLGPFGMPTDLPVVGDWTGTGKTRIGTFTPQTGQWRLDLNGNGVFDGCTIDRCVTSFGRGKTYPVVADWTGSGISQIGVFDQSSGIWQIDLNNDGIFNGCGIDRCMGPFGKVDDLPVVGQW